MVVTDFTNIIAAIGGSTLVSSWATYIFAKRKLKNEADSIEIDNLKKSLGFYQQIIDDLKDHIALLEARILKMQGRMDQMENELFEAHKK